MTFKWSYEGRLPVIFASVRSLQTQRVHVTQFLVDTGACKSCLPAHRALEWGHSADDPTAKPFSMPGVGGDCTGVLHRFRFGLVDSRKLWLPPLWESMDDEMVFLSNLTGTFGLLGMDIIQQWKDLAIRPRSGGGGVIEVNI